MSRPRSIRTPASDRNPAPDEPVDRMPIEELSRRTGVTVRNLRELQTRGLLEPPLLEGRKGLYTRRHLARVTLVRTLQDRGYSIASIADLLRRWHGALGPLGVMTVEDGVSTSGVSAERRLGEEELFAVLPALRSDARLLEEARAVELVCVDEGGRLFAPHAELIETARALLDVGIPLDVQFADFRVLRGEIDVMTRRFRTRFQEHVVKKLERQGMPPGALTELGARLVHLRPAVVHGVAIVLSSALDRGGPLGPAPAEPTAGKKAQKAKAARGGERPRRASKRTA